MWAICKLYSERWKIITIYKNNTKRRNTWNNCGSDLWLEQRTFLTCREHGHLHTRYGPRKGFPYYVLTTFLSRGQSFPSYGNELSSSVDWPLETVTSSQKLELIKHIQPRISDCFKSKWAMLQLSCLIYSWDYDIYFILCQHAAFDFDSASTQNNGPQINTSLYVDTTDKHVALRGHEDNLSLYLLLNDACVVKKQEIPRLVFGLTRPGMEPTIALEANPLTIAQSRRSATTKKGKSPHRTQRISHYQRPMK
jgi:hypothetical protein